MHKENILPIRKPYQVYDKIIEKIKEEYNKAEEELTQIAKAREAHAKNIVDEKFKQDVTEDFKKGVKELLKKMVEKKAEENADELINELNEQMKKKNAETMEKKIEDLALLDQRGKKAEDSADKWINKLNEQRKEKNAKIMKNKIEEESLEQSVKELLKLNQSVGEEKNKEDLTRWIEESIKKKKDKGQLKRWLKNSVDTIVSKSLELNKILQEGILVQRKVNLQAELKKFSEDKKSFDDEMQKEELEYQKKMTIKLKEIAEKKKLFDDERQVKELERQEKMLINTCYDRILDQELSTEQCNYIHQTRYNVANGRIKDCIQKMLIDECTLTCE